MTKKGQQAITLMENLDHIIGHTQLKLWLHLTSIEDSSHFIFLTLFTFSLCLKHLIGRQTGIFSLLREKEDSEERIK